MLYPGLLSFTYEKDSLVFVRLMGIRTEIDPYRLKVQLPIGLRQFDQDSGRQTGTLWVLLAQSLTLADIAKRHHDPLGFSDRNVGATMLRDGESS